MLAPSRLVSRVGSVVLYLFFLPGVLSSSCLLWHLRLRLHSRMWHSLCIKDFDTSLFALLDLLAFGKCVCRVMLHAVMARFFSGVCIYLKTNHTLVDKISWSSTSSMNIIHSRPTFRRHLGFGCLTIQASIYEFKQPSRKRHELQCRSNKRFTANNKCLHCIDINMREILRDLVVTLPMLVWDRRTIYSRLSNLLNQSSNLLPAIGLEIAIIWSH